MAVEIRRGCAHVKMDDTFRDFLVSGGIKEETVAYLEEELIISKKTFTFLKEEHFQKLLPKMKVQHARLLMVWEDCQVSTRNYYITYMFTVVLTLG